MEPRTARNGYRDDAADGSAMGVWCDGPEGVADKQVPEAFKAYLDVQNVKNRIERRK